MGGLRKHGKVKQVNFKPSHGRFLEIVRKLQQEKGAEEYVDYKEVYGSEEWEKWGRTKQRTRELVMELKREGYLEGPSRKFRLAILLPGERKEAPLASRKYLDLIDKRIRLLKENKKKVEEELNIIDSDIAHWKKIKEKIIQQPELVQLMLELKKLQ